MPDSPPSATFQRLRFEVVRRFRALPSTWHIQRRMFAVLIGIFLGLAILVLPHDYPVHEWIQADQSASLQVLAEGFRDWGNFTDTILFCVLLFAAGAALKRANWRQVALTVFLAATCSGLFSNVFRFSVGRERPTRTMVNLTEDPMKLYRIHGPSIDWKHNSFPSAHSATSMACGVAMLFTLPTVGWIALLSAAGVVWSSIYDGVHYLSDIMVGAGMGVVWGLWFALTHRRLFSNQEAA